MRTPFTDVRNTVDCVKRFIGIICDLLDRQAPIKLVKRNTVSTCKPRFGAVIDRAILEREIAKRKWKKPEIRWTVMNIGVEEIGLLI